MIRNPNEFGRVAGVTVMNRRELLEAAAAAVSGEREDTYGGPEDSFRTIAKLWSVWLKTKIDPSDVAAMMVLLKLARLAKAPDHQDSWLDIAGYAACGAEITSEKSEPESDVGMVVTLPPDGSFPNP